MRRVAVAGILALNPDIILFDEPMSALDVETRLALRKEIKQIQAEYGTTMIYITHDQEEAFAMADRIMVMEESKLIQLDTPMQIIENPKKALKTVFLDTVPVLTGYLFLGAGFGILLAEQTGKGVLWAFFMSIFMFAGSGQYLAVSLLANGTSLISSAIAMFLVNARHIFYGISLLGTYKGAKEKPYMIFALTDETYSLVSQLQIPEDVGRKGYCFLVTLFDHIYWVSGTVLGSLAGSLLPINYEGIEFALTALFVTIFVEQWLSTKDHIPALIGLVGSVVCLALFGPGGFLIPAMVLITALLALYRKKGGTAND